jgi:hypothetical protein
MATAFTSDECNVLAQALDTAWDIFSHSKPVESANIAWTKATLTRSILTAYENGERHPRRLAIAAIAQLDRPQRSFAAQFFAPPAA